MLKQPEHLLTVDGEEASEKSSSVEKQSEGGGRGMKDASAQILQSDSKAELFQENADSMMEVHPLDEAGGSTRLSQKELVDQA